LKQIDFKRASGMIKFYTGNCLTRLPRKLARQPSPPGIRLRRSRWRTGKARRPGARAGRI